MGPPALPGPPPTTLPLQRPSIQALPSFSGGNWSLVATTLQGEISVCTAQHLPGGRDVNTVIRGWTHPTEARLIFSPRVPAVALAQNGQSWASERVSGQGLGASQLLTDESTAELEDTFQDWAVPTTPRLHRWRTWGPQGTGSPQSYTANDNNSNNLSSIYFKLTVCQALLQVLCMDYLTQSPHEGDTVMIQSDR